MGTRRRRALPLQIAIALVTLAAATTGLTGIGRAETALHSPDVERWRPLVERYWTQYGYGDEVDYALMVMWGESWGIPTAQHPESGASGLFQHMPIYWAERSAAAGWAGADIWDPEANIAVAAWLRATSPAHGWRHWEATHVAYPPGSFGPDTHWENGRYVAMGGGAPVTTAATVVAPSGPVSPAPTITVTKIADETDGEPEILAGTNVLWTFEVTNTGESDLWNVYLWDDSLGEILCGDADRLRSGASVTCIAGERAELGLQEVAVWAFAWDADGREAAATATGSYFGVPPAGLTMEARAAGFAPDAAGPQIAEGEETLVAYRLTNTGDVNLFAPYVWDDAIGEVGCDARAIAPGETIVCTAGATLDPFSTDHMAWAWAWTEVGNQLEASDTVTYRILPSARGVPLWVRLDQRLIRQALPRPGVAAIVNRPTTGT